MYLYIHTHKRFISIYMYIYICIYVYLFICILATCCNASHDTQKQQPSSMPRQARSFLPRGAQKVRIGPLRYGSFKHMENCVVK